MTDDADVSLDDLDDGMLLIYRADLDTATGGWQEIARGGHAPGGGGMEQHANEWHNPDVALASDLTDHAAAADPHTGYQKESEKGAASGYAGLDASSKVIKNPASASAIPIAYGIPTASAAGKLAEGWHPQIASGDLHTEYVQESLFQPQVLARVSLRG
jgi:hypothetical protein